MVVPSIPGFGLSREWGSEGGRVADAWAELMRRLGYERFGAQGGDWGAAISRELGRAHPGRVIGVHLNLLPGGRQTTEPTPEELDALGPEERERTLTSWRRRRAWPREGTGYAVLQSTRPQTVAYALTDSPVGQLAWIAEEFREWTDSDELPEQAVDRDRLLTNVMLYRLTGTTALALFPAEPRPTAGR